MYNSKYFDQVFTDIQQAKNWYKEQRDGLEIEFANAIEKAIEQVLKMPLAYSLKYKNIRIAHPKIFPYNIHFYVEEESKTIVFTAIVHNKREPKLAIIRV